MDFHMNVVCLVLIDQEGKMLTCQRPEGKKMALHWEFPGGKVEQGENNEIALRREIEEELQIQLGPLQELTGVHHSYDFGNIFLPPFLCHCSQHPSLTLVEHKAVQWIYLDQWEELNWAAADLPVIISLLEERKKGRL